MILTQTRTYAGNINRQRGHVLPTKAQPPNPSFHIYFLQSTTCIQSEGDVSQRERCASVKKRC